MTFRKSFTEIRESLLNEDAPTNSVAAGGVSGLTGIPPVPPRTKFPIVRRKKPAQQTQSEDIIGKVSRTLSNINKKTKLPMDRWKEVDQRLQRHPPSGARAKASRKAYDVMAKKGYYPNPEPIREQENSYALHTIGKKLPRKTRKDTIMPADEYPPHPAINEEIEDYVVAFTLPVFIRTLEIAREKLKSDDELHIFVEKIVNLQGDDVLTMEDVADALDEYSSD